MSRDGKLLAWIEPRDGAYLVAFVAAEVRQRQPAARVFTSRDEAEDWVESEATAFDAAIEWAPNPPQDTSARPLGPRRGN